MSKTFDARVLEKIDSPDATAAAYFSQLRSPNVTPDDHLAFDSWHKRDEAHRIAWSRIERAWERAGEIGNDPRILNMRETALANRRKPPLWRRPGLAIAAAIALITFVGAPIAYRAAESGSAGEVVLSQGRTITTGVGQQALLQMADGSTVSVNTASTVIVAETENRRMAIVQDGEAFFEVATNKRKPFVVQTDGVSVTALGTAFAVRTLPGEVSVTLLEGKVRLDLPSGQDAARSIILEPGMALHLAAGEAHISRADVERSLAWREGMISFDRTPLSEAVAEFSRYTHMQIAIVSPGIADHPISGSFRVGATRTFLQALEAAGIVRVQSETAERVELAAP